MRENPNPKKYCIIQIRDLSFVQTTNSGELIILGTQLTDAGDYTCHSTNEAGTDSAVVTLEVGCTY